MGRDHSNPTHKSNADRSGGVPKMAGQAERQSPYSFLPLDLHMLLAATWNAPLGVAVRARRP
jgi:hypothetical protein